MPGRRPDIQGQTILARVARQRAKGADNGRIAGMRLWAGGAESCRVAGSLPWRGGAGRLPAQRADRRLRIGNAAICDDPIPRRTAQRPLRDDRDRRLLRRAGPASASLRKARFRRMRQCRNSVLTVPNRT